MGSRIDLCVLGERNSWGAWRWGELFEHRGWFGISLTNALELYLDATEFS